MTAFYIGTCPPGHTYYYMTLKTSIKTFGFSNICILGNGPDIQYNVSCYISSIPLENLYDVKTVSKEEFLTSLIAQTENMLLSEHITEETKKNLLKIKQYLRVKFKIN